MQDEHKHEPKHDMYMYVYMDMDTDMDMGMNGHWDTDYRGLGMFYFWDYRINILIRRLCEEDDRLPFLLYCFLFSETCPAHHQFVHGDPCVG